MDVRSLPPHAQEVWRSYEEPLRSISFMVLVWGSGGSKPEAHEKRLMIRKHLETCLPANTVFMSEDPLFQPMVDEAGLVGAEKIQAEMADVIIVLGTSVGPLTEVATYKEAVRSKGLLFV